MVLLFSINMLIIIMLLSYIKNKTLLSVNVVFSFMWSICLGISSLGLYGIYAPNDDVYILSFLTIVTFNIVYFCTGYRIKKEVMRGLERKTEPMVLTGRIKLKLLYLFNFFAYLYSIQFIPKAFALINLYGFYGLRDYAFTETTLLATTHQLLIFQWGLGPLFMITILIASVLSSQQRSTRILNIVALFDVALYTFLFGGRYMIVKMLMYFIFSFLIVNRDGITNILKERKKVLFSAVILLLILFALTYQRGFSDRGFLGNILIYYTGSFTYLSKLLETTSWSAQLLYGTGLFGFLTNFILIPASILGGFDYNGSNQIVTEITQNYIYISDAIPYNAMGTMLFTFIMDFGYFGVIVDTAIYAFIVTQIERYFYKRKTLFSLCIYVFVLFTVFDSVMTYSFLGPGMMIALIFLYIFTLCPKLYWR